MLAFERVSWLAVWKVRETYTGMGLDVAQHVLAMIWLLRSR